MRAGKRVAPRETQRAWKKQRTLGRLRGGPSPSPQLDFVLLEEERGTNTLWSKVAIDQSAILPRKKFMPCCDPIMATLMQVCPLFTAPTWKNLMTLLRGILLARGRRTVAAALWQTDHHPDSHLSAFHQVEGVSELKNER